MKGIHLLVSTVCVVALMSCAGPPAPPAQKRPGGVALNPSPQPPATETGDSSFNATPDTNTSPPQPTIPQAETLAAPSDAAETPAETNAAPEAIAFQPPGEQAFFEEELLRVSIMPTQESRSDSGSTCSPDPTQIPRVAATTNRMSALTQEFTLWMIGFPPGQEIELSIIGPEGSKKPWTIIRAPDSLSYDSVSCGPATFFSLDGFLSLSMGPPDWRLSASYPGGTVEAAIIPWQQSQWWAGGPVLTHNPQPPGDPSHPLDPALSRAYLPGETLYLQGANFPSGGAVPLALYRGNSQLELVGTSTIEVDENGQISTSIHLDSSMEEGDYAVVAYGMVPEGERYAQNLQAAAFHVLSGLPYRPCRGAASSFLRTGDRAAAASSEGRPLRSSPDTSESSGITGEIPPGAKVLLLSGPACSFNEPDAVWWYVLDETSHQIGWTQESSEVEQWLTRTD